MKIKRNFLSNLIKIFKISGCLPPEKLVFFLKNYRFHSILYIFIRKRSSLYQFWHFYTKFYSFSVIYYYWPCEKIILPFKCLKLIKQYLKYFQWIELEIIL